MDREGSLYALQRDRGEMAVFDPAGVFVRWIRGGRGEGPGEFTSAADMAFVGDTLWIRNRTPPRISRFLRDGTHVGTDRVQVEVDYRTTAGLQGISGYLAGGRAWMEPDGFVMSEGGAEAPFTLGDRAMEAQDTVFVRRAGRGRLGGTSFAPLPEPPFHDVAPDGSGVPTADEVREAVYLPAYHPPIRDLRLGLDGTIWLERSDGLDPGPWVALGSDGSPLFQVRLPSGARLREASREAVWATMRDALEVPYVVRWNLVAPGGG